MSPELEDKLVKDFPKLFSGRARPITENLMAFGCECGDGWEPIIRDFCQAVMYVYQNEPEDQWPIFIQIKEKFGTIRLYLDSYSDRVDSAERMAEYASARTCEICGNPGKMNETGYWMSVRCQPCREKQNQK